MKVIDQATIVGRGIISVIDALPDKLENGMFVCIGDRHWKVRCIDKTRTGQPAGLLLHGRSPLPSVGDTIEVERPLFQFRNGCPEWVIAYDVKDACEIYFILTGVPAEDYDGEDDWEKLDPQATSKFWLDENGEVTDTSGTLTEMTNAEACERFGHGFYATSEM